MNSQELRENAVVDALKGVDDSNLIRSTLSGRRKVVVKSTFNIKAFLRWLSTLTS